MSEDTKDYESSSTPEDKIEYWLNEICEAEKREKEYRKTGTKILDIYNANSSVKIPFNILFSNVDTLIPALYSSIPRPDIQRRYNDPDPMGKAVCDAGNRMLEFLIDTNLSDDETFHDSMGSSVLDALIFGRGVTRLNYNAEIIDDEIKEKEYICFEAVEWDRIIFGYSKKWSKVPWIAFEESIDKEEAIRLFGKEIADKIKFLRDEKTDDQDNGDEKSDDHQGGRKLAVIYQIWDKLGDKKVRYVSKCYKDDFLKVDDDPLELTGFWPIPKPLQLIDLPDEMEVVPPYLEYESQAKELNEISRRIIRLVGAIKAKGVYDAELGSDIENLLSGDENTFIPADKSAALASEKGFDNLIWMMPLAGMVAVLHELYTAREACKQIIYEITGISDIIRGSTNANETATAQNIKTQWGTMRLKRNQFEVQRYARDILRIVLEIAATKFSEKTWADITQLPYSSDQQINQAKQVMSFAQRLQAQNPNIQPTQQQAQQLQQAQTVLQQPSWSQVLGILKNDLQRSYKVDIETNSTIIPESVEDQKNIAEVMGALGQYLKGIEPLIQQGIFPFEAAKAMILSIVRRFAFGPKIEEYIEQMQPPPPPVDKTAGDSQMKMQLAQAEMQVKQQSEQAALQTEIQKVQANNQLEMQKIEANKAIENERLMIQIQLEQMRLDSAKELEIMRIISAEKIAEITATIQANSNIEAIRLQNDASLDRVRIQEISNMNDDNLGE